MILQAINPTVPNTITELFLLPVQYVLKNKRIQQKNISENPSRHMNKHMMQKWIQTFGKYGFLSSSNALRSTHFSILPRSGLICAICHKFHDMSKKKKITSRAHKFNFIETYCYKLRTVHRHALYSKQHHMPREIALP